ncbi:MAG: cytochrome P460 family protein [Acidobacteria bacterium]|nr:cytochrome P460 family protein [Acidobacteriota bacterium]
MNNATKFLKFFALAGIALACLLLFISSPAPTATAQSKPSPPSTTEKSAAVFEDQNTLLRPEGYREWVFVGSSTGLNYSPNPAPSSSTSGTDFKNVYINPSSYREFVKTGTFPEGTVMVLEIAQAANKNEPGLQGSFASKYVALEASVKDSKRFPGGWAYFGFTDRDGNLRAKAQPFPDSACLACHQVKAATDRVFTQFYPVLNAARAK